MDETSSHWKIKVADAVNVTENTIYDGFYVEIISWENR